LSDIRKTVAEGYERLGPKYWEWSRANDPQYRELYLEPALALLDAGSLVVELGSGSGLPAGAIIAERHRLVCVDVARAQLDLVGTNVPSAKRVLSDMSTVEFAPGRVDAVVAFYSIIHVPREDHAKVFASIMAWLRPGGVFVASLGASDNPVDRDDWIDDVLMFWSSWDAETNRNLVTEAGFRIVRDEVLKNFEDNRTVRFYWVLAQKSG
jgi:SAM-dependent methyltransferase